MKSMVLGFYFSPDLEEVLLIKKTKPDWQAGKLNGIGGKVEKTELSVAAMSREMAEEANLDLFYDRWSFGGYMKGDDWDVCIFYAICQNPVERECIQSLTEEEVGWYKTSDIVHGGKYDVMNNLPFIIQMCLCLMKNDGLRPLRIEYSYE